MKVKPSAQEQEFPGPPSVRQPVSLDPTATTLALFEQLRASLHQGLDRIAALASEFPGSAAGSDDLQRRARELQETQDRLKADAERREREQSSKLEELERDRRLLAAAWERLEQEQIGLTSPGRTPSPTPAPGEFAPTPHLRTPSPDRGEESPIAQAILRQFEALRRDVRRHAQEQCSD